MFQKVRRVAGDFVYQGLKGFNTGLGIVYPLVVSV